MNKFQECYKIYCEAFGEEDSPFTNLLFENCFKNCFFYEVQNQIASMFFALECNIETKTHKIPAIYIYAAATAKKFRSKGYMSKLLESFKSEIDSNSVVFLRPANDGLISFYKKCGFKVISAINETSGFPLVKPLNSFAKLTSEIDGGNGEKFTLMYYSKNPRDLENLHFIYSME